MTRTKVLADEGGGGIAQSPRGQNRKDDDANRDGVRGQGGRTEKADNPDQPDPARLANQELQNSGDGYPHQAPKNRALEAHVAAQNTDTFRPHGEPVELVKDPDAASGKGGERRAGDPQ